MLANQSPEVSGLLFKEAWDYCLLSPQRSWNYLSANNEAIAHALRYIIPINGYNNPKREHIAITLAD